MIPVDHLMFLLAEGVSQQEILDEWNFLEPEDIQAALRYRATLPGGNRLIIAMSSLGDVVTVEDHQVRVRLLPIA